MWVYKHTSGKYCKFGSYSTCSLVTEAYKGTLYSNKNVALNRNKDSFYIKGALTASKHFILVKIKINVIEVEDEQV